MKGPHEVVTVHDVQSLEVAIFYFRKFTSLKREAVY